MCARLVIVCLGLLYWHNVTAVTAPKVNLNDGHEMPTFGLGTALGNNTQGRIEPVGNEVESAVLCALQAGYRHIDTAYHYGTEQQIKTALRKKFQEGMRREDNFITTKLWNDFHSREAVLPALKKSLDHLGLEYVDLYLIHWPIGQFANQTFDYTDYLDTWRGMTEVKQLGLARSIGVSNFNESQLQRIIDNGLETPAVLQVEVNLNLQQPSLLSYCKLHNFAVMGYTPFGSLFYNKAKEDAPPPRLDDPKLVAIANKYGKTVPQIVLRYLLDLKITPIPKSLTRSRIEQNIDVFNFTLTEAERTLLKGYDRGYRTIPQLKWKEHPYYPF